ncbi:MAG: hypothetical protein AB4038_05140 [Prochloraceae cyanobacterium]
MAMHYKLLDNRKIIMETVELLINVNEKTGSIYLDRDYFFECIREFQEEGIIQDLPGRVTLQKFLTNY